MKVHKYNGSFCLLDEAYDNGFTFHEYKTLEDAMHDLQRYAKRGLYQGGAWPVKVEEVQA